LAFGGSSITHPLGAHPQVPEIHFLHAPVGRLDNHPSFFPMHGDLLVADLPHQVHWFSGSLFQRKQNLVPGHRRFQGLSHLVFSPEKPIRRHQAPNPLMRPEMVVVVDEVAQASPSFIEFLRRHTVPKLFHHRCPEPLCFPDRLRVMGPGHHVLNPLALQQSLEITLPTPGEILTTLVGQDFFRLPEPVDA
jgi:hypothetical protein